MPRRSAVVGSKARLIPSAARASFILRELLLSNLGGTRSTCTILIRLFRLMDLKEDLAIAARGKACRHMTHVGVALRYITCMELTVEAVRGSKHGLAFAEIVAKKFDKLAGQRVSAAQVNWIIHALLDAECLDDAQELSCLLVAGGNTGH